MVKVKKKISLVECIFIMIALIFVVFLIVPMLTILFMSFWGDGGVELTNYTRLITEGMLLEALGNSVGLSSISAVISTLLAFMLAYTVNFTNVPNTVKKSIPLLTTLTMLLPTITYGFAIIYSFGKQGLITKIIGFQLFEIYGPYGLVLGYVIYTLPIAFLLINNTMKYIDKKFIIVSRAMGDTALKNFLITIIRPLLGTFAASFIQTFTLCFTDYGIPTSLGGNIKLISTTLYENMLGSVPDFNAGSAVAITMLLPSILSIMLLTYLEKYNIRYNKISVIELKKSKTRDVLCGTASSILLACLLSVFAVIFIVPFVEQWPYKIIPTFDIVKSVLEDTALVSVYKNSIFVSAMSAVFGTLVVYGAALISARSPESRKLGKILDSVALVSNAIPGMVIGVAYLLTFTGTPLQNTFPLIIISNIIHFFSSPYLIMKNSLEKLNSSWETTARLMGDSWLKSVVRIITPNAFSSLVEVFSYYFINSMVTISAVIFIAGARTMVITAKIKELQHFANFNEIFVLSILILITNLVAKGLLSYFSNKTQKNV